MRDLNSTQKPYLCLTSSSTPPIFPRPPLLSSFSSASFEPSNCSMLVCMRTHSITQQGATFPSIKNKKIHLNLPLLLLFFPHRLAKFKVKLPSVLREVQWVTGMFPHVSFSCQAPMIGILHMSTRAGCPVIFCPLTNATLVFDISQTNGTVFLNPHYNSRKSWKKKLFTITYRAYQTLCIG